MSATVILLGSQAHVGKDTLGELLIENDGFIRFGFADKLKEVVADLYGFSHEQMHGDLKNVPDGRYTKQIWCGDCDNDPSQGGWQSHILTPREVLQDFGQEQRKRFPDIWADYVCRQIAGYPTCSGIAKSSAPWTKHDKFVITDFRFPNEHTVVKRFAEQYGWDVAAIKLNRPDELRGEVAGATNISETALDDFSEWNYVIENDTNSRGILYESYRCLYKATSISL